MTDIEILDFFKQVENKRIKLNTWKHTCFFPESVDTLYAQIIGTIYCTSTGLTLTKQSFPLYNRFKPCSRQFYWEYWEDPEILGEELQKEYDKTNSKPESLPKGKDYGTTVCICSYEDVISIGCKCGHFQKEQERKGKQ